MAAKRLGGQAGGNGKGKELTEFRRAVLSQKTEAGTGAPGRAVRGAGVETALEQETGSQPFSFLFSASSRPQWGCPRPTQSTHRSVLRINKATHVTVL